MTGAAAAANVIEFDRPPEAADPVLELVKQHMAAEDRHDVEATVATFTEDCHYYVASLRARLAGKPAIAGWYRQLFSAVPDLTTSEDRFFRGEDDDGSPVVWHQATLEGTQLGPLHGWAPTGRRFAVPMLVRIPIAPDGLMQGEEVYFDTADLFSQLGILPPRHGPIEGVLRQLHRLRTVILPG